MIGRIALPKSTTLSLNERFSQLRQLREQKQQQVQRQHVEPQQPARLHLGGSASSLENQRLARQMESRPSVVAALRGQKTMTPSATALAMAAAAAAAAPQTRLHPRQRLAIHARLGVIRSPAGGGATGAGRSILARLGRVRPAVKRLQTARSGRLGMANGWSRVPRGAARARGRGRGAARNVPYSSRANVGGGWRGRGGLRGRGRGRGRGGARGRGPKLTREELDKQLDEYMASTKFQLDAELDSYMKQSVITGE